MPRDKDKSASGTVSLGINGLRGTTNLILKHLINSSREVQGIIDSDTKTIMKVLSLKTRVNDKPKKVEELDENNCKWT